jgi:hypothetical protein
VTALIRLYPRTWRDRYEDEFLALLAERPPDARDRLDIIRGAVDARLRPQVRRPDPGPENDPSPGPISTRSLGWTAIVGAGVWLSALVIAMNGPMVVDGDHTYRDGGAAIPFVFLAWVLLSAGLYGVARSLPLHAASTGGAAVALAIVMGGMWSLMIWMVPFLALATLGLVTMAVVAFRSGVWGRLDTAILLGGLTASWTVGILLMLGLLGAWGSDAYALFFVSLTSVWVAVGHSLIVARGSHIAGVSIGDR